MTNENPCAIVSGGEELLRQEQRKRLKADSDHFIQKLEDLKKQMELLDGEFALDSEVRRLARLLYAGQLVERVGLLYSFNEQAFCEFLTANKEALQKPPV